MHERRFYGCLLIYRQLLARVPLHVEQARLLIRVGALRFTGKSKPSLLWDLTLLHRPATVRTTGDLFITKVEEPRLPSSTRDSTTRWPMPTMNWTCSASRSATRSRWWISVKGHW